MRRPAAPAGRVGVADRIRFLTTAADACLYGYPLVAMDVTRDRFERFVARL